MTATLRAQLLALAVASANKTNSEASKASAAAYWDADIANWASAVSTAQAGIEGAGGDHSAVYLVDGSNGVHYSVQYVVGAWTAEVVAEG